VGNPFFLRGAPTLTLGEQTPGGLFQHREFSHLKGVHRGFWGHTSSHRVHFSPLPFFHPLFGLRGFPPFFCLVWFGGLTLLFFAAPKRGSPQRTLVVPSIFGSPVETPDLCFFLTPFLKTQILGGFSPLLFWGPPGVFPPGATLLHTGFFFGGRVYQRVFVHPIVHRRGTKVCW